MIDSLLKVAPNLKIYILPTDDLCNKVLSKENKQNIILVNFNELMVFEDLFRIREERPFIEFYYTLTSHLIDFVLKRYNEPICTYLDADMFFYDNPEVVIEEMGNKDVQIISHGFSQKRVDRIKKEESGEFCVEFNTFKNSEKALELLSWWKERCREYCGYENGNFGDQKYLDAWKNNENVSIVANPGAGIAPWNINQYIFHSQDGERIFVKKRCGSLAFPIIFYHFENIQYIDENTVDINVYKMFLFNDNKVIKLLYTDYLKRISRIKRYLQKEYGLDIMIRRHPSEGGRKNKDYHINIRLLPLKIRNRFIKFLNRKKDIVHF